MSVSLNVLTAEHLQALSVRVYTLAISMVTWLDDTLPSAAADDEIMHKLGNMLAPLR